MLKKLPWDLRKTSFQKERVQQITKTKDADQCKISKRGVKIQPKSMKNGPCGLTNVTLKNIAQKVDKKIEK